MRGGLLAVAAPLHRRNADAHLMAALFGDETSFRHDIALVDMGSAGRGDAGCVAPHPSGQRRIAAACDAWDNAPGAVTRSAPRERAKSSGPIATWHRDWPERMGFGEATIECLGQIYERWDGRGLPNRLEGESIAPAVRIVTLRRTTSPLPTPSVPEEALATVARRRGKAPTIRQSPIAFPRARRDAAAIGGRSRLPLERCPGVRARAVRDTRRGPIR